MWATGEAFVVICRSRDKASELWIDRRPYLDAFFTDLYKEITRRVLKRVGFVGFRQELGMYMLDKSALIGRRAELSWRISARDWD